MTLLALGVAGYTSMAAWNPDAIDFIARRDGFLRQSLIVHALAGSVALALGPFQFLSRLRNRHRRVHRASGWVYLLCILISGLTGLWLAFFTPGGPPV
ncbi:DUF2306 domain-containing protein [Gammaproteobacteria bacterium AB-CW1]|uniref:DUF2306 domain-containing protein n=1 Tax=Natronospira elongata TaxID=3110268 RepID=A0AAP6JHD9_9GAMM|nr:DUF2306 domain-containing protein [Gammaproteobacteria bacterium AB-CW1]